MISEVDDSGAENPSMNGSSQPQLSRKRCISTSSDEGKSKIPKLEDEDNHVTSYAGDGIEKVNLLDLSDDVLLIIMSHLNAVDLMSLRKCCQRLARVASDWSLWINVDFRSDILSESELLSYVSLLRDTTERIAIRGYMEFYPEEKTQCLSKELLSSISTNCKSLKSLIVEQHFINANDLKISHFPSSLIHLSLEGSKIINLPKNSSYFVEIHRHIPNLQVVELSGCTWLPPHSIMALSKLPHLEELRLDGCTRLKDCIAYASIAFNLGFSKLQILDLRGTGISDSELASINRSNRLTHLYLERFRPRMAMRVRNFCESSSDSSNPDSSDEELDDQYALHNTYTVSDTGLRSLVISEKTHANANHLFNIRNDEIIVSAVVQDKVSRCRLHTLVARNFQLVTDATLQEMRHVQTLRYLDLKDTRISKEGVDSFRRQRPDVTLITNFDNVT